MKRLGWRLCAMLAAGVAAPCAAQVHAGDVILTLDAENRLITNAAADGTLLEPERVFGAEFGAEGFADFTNDPGFDSPVGSLPPGVVIGFDIMRALRVWDSDGQSFEEIPVERIRIRKSGVDRFTPTTDMVVPGFVFGDVNGSGVFHHHVSYALVDAPMAGPDGVWLLELELWSETGVLGRTEPFWIVFAQGAGSDEQAAAIQWVRDNLIGSPCPADFNGDGVVDFFDVQAFLGAFAGQEPPADLNDDGLFDFFDVQDFLNLFAGGCG